jgi:hypothetical protein
MKIPRDARSAAIGGLAAVFVVTASLAPKLLDHSPRDEVAVRTASNEASDTVTSTTPTSRESTTSTTGDLAARVDHVEKRVNTVEQRVTVIEQTTTSTAPAPTATTTSTPTTAMPVVTPTTTPAPPSQTWVEIAHYQFGADAVTKVEIPYRAQTGKVDVRAFWADNQSDAAPVRVDVDKLRDPMTPGDTTYARSPRSGVNLWSPATAPGAVMLTLTLDSGAAFVPPYLVTVKEYR